MPASCEYQKKIRVILTIYHLIYEIVDLLCSKEWVVGQLDKLVVRQLGVLNHYTIILKEFIS